MKKKKGKIHLHDTALPPVPVCLHTRLTSLRIEENGVFWARHKVYFRSRASLRPARPFSISPDPQFDLPESYTTVLEAMYHYSDLINQQIWIKHEIGTS